MHNWLHTGCCCCTQTTIISWKINFYLKNVFPLHASFQIIQIMEDNNNDEDQANLNLPNTDHLTCDKHCPHLDRHGWPTWGHWLTSTMLVLPESQARLHWQGPSILRGLPWLLLAVWSPRNSQGAHLVGAFPGLCHGYWQDYGKVVRWGHWEMSLCEQEGGWAAPHQQQLKLYGSVQCQDSEQGNQVISMY